MPTSIGTLRHCLMAGLCSAAEPTGTRGGRNPNYKDERTRLNGTQWRCPYTRDTTAHYAKPKNTDTQYSQITLHCERLWIEENA